MLPLTKTLLTSPVDDAKCVMGMLAIDDMTYAKTANVIKMMGYYGYVFL